MKKSVYSLVLMDDVVSAIDELAYSLHTSRSNLINQILAERVAMVTPKQHVQTIFDCLSEFLKPYAHFQIQSQADDHMYSIKSALRYKYNPTIRYSVYLGKENGKLVGQLKLISRTQSSLLFGYLDHFFRIWIAIENECQEVSWEQEEGAKWQRKLLLDHYQEVASGMHLADQLCQYIKLIDDGLKLYFGHLDRPEEQYELLRSYYYESYPKMDEMI